MEKINEQMYRANIDLVDKNRLLEEDKKILTKRMNKAIEYIEYICKQFDKIEDKELITNRVVDIKCFKNTLNILKGRYVSDE